MDFSTIGSVSTYMKSLELETKFKNKKAQGDLGPQSRKKTELEIKNDQFKADYKRMQEEQDDDKTLADINNKIAIDQELTPDELRYLQNKNPTLYQKVKNIENEKKQYEKDLKGCKTKEDVEHLKFNKVASALSTIKAAENDPHIPLEKKLEIAQGEMRRMNALNKVSAKFVRNGEYEKLPTEQEVLDVEKELAEAEQAEREKVTEASDTEESGENVNEGTADTDKNIPVETASDEDVVTEEKTSKLDIESSPEAQKIKHSKAKKAYNEAKKNYIPQQIIVPSDMSVNASDKILGGKSL